MKKFFAVGMALFLVLFLFPYAYANLGFKTNESGVQTKKIPPAPVTPTPSGRIESGNNGISLNFQDFRLGDILQNIADETGIHFHTSPAMEDILVNANVTANDWPTALQRLLSDYSRVEVWTSDLETSHIWLMKSTAYKPTDKNSEVRTAGIKGQNNFTKRTQQVTIQRPAVDPESITSMLPPHLLFDPGVIKYLQSVGISLPEAMKSLYEPMMVGLPEDTPISPPVLYSQEFKNLVTHLKSLGIEPPKGFEKIS